MQKDMSLKNIVTPENASLKDAAMAFVARHGQFAQYTQWAFSLPVFPVGSEEERLYQQFLAEGYFRPLVPGHQGFIHLFCFTRKTMDFGWNILYLMASFLRPDERIYISLETRLNEVGYIEQIPALLTLGTNGTSECIHTCIGRVEFTHTPDVTDEEISLDEGRMLFVATPKRATADLFFADRNTHLLIEDPDPYEIVGADR